jgi:ribosome-associated translation inhibitor RaiA/cold shock CspA family protein
MQTPLEIAFHNLQSSEHLEADIRERAGKLTRLYDRLTACRVSVEADHKQHRTGNLYQVHIVMTVPGQELVVSRELHKAKQRYADPDIHTSIREAFKAAERQLKEFKRKLRGEVKPHDAMFQGQVSQLYPGQEHGFILTSTGTQLYFHRNALMEGAFDALARGTPVHYVETDGDTGPMASKVWLAAPDRNGE